jgi:Fe-S-cluster containining protein
VSELDCLSCGACCYGPDEYVAVSGPDKDRMGARTASRYVIRSGGRWYLRMVNSHCAALHARQGHFSCRIYGARPAVCRVVEPGSRECLVARKRRGVDAERE